MGYTPDEVKSELDLANEELSERIETLAETANKQAESIRNLETRLAARDRFSKEMMHKVDACAAAISMAEKTIEEMAGHLRHLDPDWEGPPRERRS